MKPILDPRNYSVSAFCPTCKAITSFDERGKAAKEYPGGRYEYGGRNYAYVTHIYSQCARCGEGGLAKVPNNGDRQTAMLEDFYPISVVAAPLPSNVPDDIRAEFREAERCTAIGANRAASALFRSVLEKTLKANGYTKGNDPSLRDLQKRIDAAAADGAITDARRRRAHDNIRSLGNDVLHDDWRPVDDEEVEEAHRYSQRILEDLYDDRVTVEALLAAKGRLPPPAGASAPP